MNENSSTHHNKGKLLSDDQMDSLLRDFFRLEVPIQLNEPHHFDRPMVSMPPVVSGRMVMEPQPRSVRFVMVAASVAAMAMAVVVAISANSSQSSDGNSVANQGQNNSVPKPNSDQPMLVSPRGDSRESTNVVSPDGVTLEETENIELHPPR